MKTSYQWFWKVDFQVEKREISCYKFPSLVPLCYTYTSKSALFTKTNQVESEILFWSKYTEIHSFKIHFSLPKWRQFLSLHYVFATKLLIPFWEIFTSFYQVLSNPSLKMDIFFTIFCKPVSHCSMVSKKWCLFKMGSSKVHRVGTCEKICQLTIKGVTTSLQLFLGRCRIP